MEVFDIRLDFSQLLLQIEEIFRPISCIYVGMVNYKVFSKFVHSCIDKGTPLKRQSSIVYVRYI